MIEINTYTNKNSLFNQLLDELDEPININKTLGEVLSDAFLGVVSLIVVVILICG